MSIKIISVINVTKELNLVNLDKKQKLRKERCRMENASKALIIAGAILLAILLISFGIMIFNQAQDTVNNSGMSQAQIQTFNNKFLKYEGLKRAGSEVKSLLNEVIASNSDTNNPHIDAKLAGTAITDTKDILTNKTYKVELQYGTNGAVSIINLTANP